MNELDRLIAESNAERSSVQQYAHRAGELFDLEDLQRAIGDVQRASDYHWAAIIAGHAAWAEDRDPEVFQ